MTINQASGQFDPAASSPINFEAVFSEPVSGFSASDVILSGTAGATTAVVSGGPSSYTIAVSGMTRGGTVIASIPANVAQDAGGNANSASTSTDNTVHFIANSPPTAVADSYSVNEDDALNEAAPGVLGNDTDPDTGDPLEAVLVSGPSHAASFTLNADGSFDYTPSADYNGADSFTYKARDASNAESEPVSVSLTVNAVNDTPSFTSGANVAVAEDSGAYSAPWATEISAGPANESAQTLTFDITGNTNPALFSAGPQITSDGTLSFTPAPGGSGSASVTVVLKDNGDTADGGQDTSAPVTFTITVDAVNDAPVAANDSATTDEDTAKDIAVLSNDNDSDGDTLSVSSFTQPAHGTVSENADGTLKYTPNANYNGPESFTYKATDGTEDSNTATVSITVNPVNDVPTVAVAAGGSCSGTSVSATMNLTLGDVETAADTLTLSGSSSNTSLVPNANVSFGGSGANRTVTITPAAKKSGSATITITVSDGAAINTTTIKVIVGTDKKETINGTSGSDMIFGLNGDDTINAGNANDLVCGGTINGGAGENTLDGGNGDDVLNGGDNNDTLRGGSGNDTLNGENGDDTLSGGMGADFFSGGSGTDVATDFKAGEGDTQSAIP